MPDKNQKTTPAIDFIAQYDAMPFSADTVTLHSLALSFSPMEANTTHDKDPETGEVFSFFQLLGNFKASYKRVTSTGEVLNDNATLNTIKVSISKEHMIKDGVTGAELKDFFYKHYVLKRVLTIPLSSYSPENRLWLFSRWWKTKTYIQTNSCQK